MEHTNGVAVERDGQVRAPVIAAVGAGLGTLYGAACTGGLTAPKLLGGAAVAWLSYKAGEMCEEEMGNNIGSKIVSGWAGWTMGIIGAATISAVDGSLAATQED